MLDLGATGHLPDDVEVLGLDDRFDQQPAFGGAGLVEDHRGEMAHLGAHRETEQQQLHRGNAEDHAECSRIAAQLDELLAHHRPEQRGAERGEEPLHRLHAAASSRRCSSMKTSSMVGRPNCDVTISGVPTAIRCPRERKARRCSFAASSM